jgi:hypothetical protein
MEKTKLFTASFLLILLGLILLGAAAFAWSLLQGHPEVAWRAYLVNFLLFSAIAQGALLFSAMMNTVGARWSFRWAGLSEAFTAFFPVSLLLFLGLLFGAEYIFSWQHHDLHGKEGWLNIPFLFSRDMAGLLILYGFGSAYLYYALGLKFDASAVVNGKGLRRWLIQRWAHMHIDREKYERRKTIFGVLYLLAFALILSLLAFDLVMSADPHWYSTLFGAYSFVKAIYIGFGALILLAAYFHLNRNIAFELTSEEFLDMGKLFFAFCLVWADFFYCQLVVIWYGNIPEETAYVITRTMSAPWNRVAWAVFIVCFVIPFVILLNRRIKTVPPAMMVLCGLVIAGMWMEHYLLLGPALDEEGGRITMTVLDVMVSVGFGGLLILSISLFLNRFPELIGNDMRKMEGREGR